MTDDHKTIVSIKIRGNRTTKDLWLMCKLLGGVFLFLMTIGVVQVRLCQDKDANKTWQECLVRENRNPSRK